MTPIEQAAKALQMMKLEQAIYSTKVEIAQVRYDRLILVSGPNPDIKNIVTLGKLMGNLGETLSQLYLLKQELEDNLEEVAH